MILSVLIAVLPKRLPVFTKLLDGLMKQINHLHENHPSLGTVEVIYDSSSAFLDGGLSVGGKRDALRKRATGTYSLFLDDDELIAPNYIETIVRLCQKDADVVSFRCLFKCDTYWTIINMSLKNTKDVQATPEKIVQRRIWHVCAIKTEITKLESFDTELNHNEDATWLNKIIPHLKTEAHTNRVLLQYNHSDSGSEADKILQAGYK